jgi:hypothetical protein
MANGVCLHGKRCMQIRVHSRKSIWQVFAMLKSTSEPCTRFQLIGATGRLKCSISVSPNYDEAQKYASKWQQLKKVLVARRRQGLKMNSASAKRTVLSGIGYDRISAAILDSRRQLRQKKQALVAAAEVGIGCILLEVDFVDAQGGDK